jgi:hypothetical protein
MAYHAGTTHKKAFLRWYEKLAGTCMSEGSDSKQLLQQLHDVSQSESIKRVKLQVIDVGRSKSSGLVEKITLMSAETGDTYAVGKEAISTSTPESASPLESVGTNFEEGNDIVVETLYDKYRNSFKFLNIELST